MVTHRITIYRQYLITCLTLFVSILIIVGCSGDETSVPVLELDPKVIVLEKNSQRTVIKVDNNGETELVWSIPDKPDWIFLSLLSGEITPDSSIKIILSGDFNNPLATYSDTIYFESDGGNVPIEVTLTIDRLLPLNGKYVGITIDSLDIAMQIDFDQIIEFEGHYFTDPELKIENIPVFGSITYADSGFIATGSHGDTLSASSTGVDSIGGIWIGATDRDIEFNLVLTNEE